MSVSRLKSDNSGSDEGRASERSRRSGSFRFGFLQEMTYGRYVGRFKAADGPRRLARWPQACFDAESTVSRLRKEPLPGTPNAIDFRNRWSMDSPLPFDELTLWGSCRLLLRIGE